MVSAPLLSPTVHSDFHLMVSAPLLSSTVHSDDPPPFTASKEEPCDDGSSCPAGAAPSTCDVSERPTAPEHGICQALGFDTAVTVEWGGGEGADDAEFVPELEQHRGRPRRARQDL